MSNKRRMLFAVALLAFGLVSAPPCYHLADDFPVLRTIYYGEMVMDGPDMGSILESKTGRTIRVFRQLFSAPITSAFGVALARAGVSDRSLMPEQSMPPYEAGEPLIFSIRRGWVFCASFSVQRTLLSNQYWLDTANTIITNRGFWHEAGCVSRMCKLPPSGLLSTMLMICGLIVDVLIPFGLPAVLVMIFGRK